MEVEIASVWMQAFLNSWMADFHAQFGRISLKSIKIEALSNHVEIGSVPHIRLDEVKSWLREPFPASQRLSADALKAMPGLHLLRGNTFKAFETHLRTRSPYLTSPGLATSLTANEKLTLAMSTSKV